MTDPRTPHERCPDAAGGDTDSATALGSHWFERPAAGRPAGAEKPTPIGPAVPQDARPDRVDGDVRRFGPGVTVPAPAAPTAVTAVAVWHGDGTPPPDRRTRRTVRLRRLRRWALAAAVLVTVLALLTWQRYGQSIAVENVSARPGSPTLGCEGTADIVGVVGTNGRPGTLVYRWVRSDGTTSGLLREKLARGQEQARLRLLWSFTGRGDYSARAELRVVSPSAHRSTARFDYFCRLGSPPGR
ncbi:hypothetical protein [Streptomyces yaizuensis]|uniref:Ig-like domain-containing protein n=1 Tax=Streptomyces yaizuensis TaxID=2989713 RepID=A0ABQ5P367_9ACTN|nr:hypothetical protein [Streptomyces sp. YSPA8]GLF96935.1 hypothetical protein SYYSPA8_21580 [Streptomyces sp. YSPA8]